MTIKLNGETTNLSLVTRTLLYQKRISSNIWRSNWMVKPPTSSSWAECHFIRKEETAAFDNRIEWWNPRPFTCTLTLYPAQTTYRSSYTATMGWPPYCIGVGELPRTQGKSGDGLPGTKHVENESFPRDFIHRNLGAVTSQFGQTVVWAHIVEGHRSAPT